VYVCTCVYECVCVRVGVCVWSTLTRIGCHRRQHEHQTPHGLVADGRAWACACSHGVMHAVRQLHETGDRDCTSGMT
jgi:hypothetical protein